MVFADRRETISGGNFHGEYPAKVSHHTTVIGLSYCIQNLSGNLYLANNSELIYSLIYCCANFWGGASKHAYELKKEAMLLQR